MNFEIKEFKELLDVVPQEWKDYIVGFFLITICFYIIIFLIKQSQAILPKKNTVKSKEEILNEYIKNVEHLDQNISDHFKGLQDEELFYRVTKIKCKKNLRDGLLWFYLNSSSRFSWWFIKSAFPYIYEKNWNLFVKISTIDLILWLFCKIISSLCIILTSILMLLLLKSKVINLSVFIIFIILFIPLGFLFGVSSALALPVTRADMINSEINRIRGIHSKRRSNKKKSLGLKIRDRLKGSRKHILVIWFVRLILMRLVRLSWTLFN
jgi:hypothetical protein